MIALMSTSLKVVSMAAVVCASFSRRAMVWRRRVMRTRSSRAASFGPEGARSAWAGTGMLAGRVLPAAAAAWSAARRATAASASSLRIWPRRPEPTTSAALSPSSAMILRAAGAGGMAPSPTGSAAGDGLGAAGAAGCAADFCACGAGAGVGPAAALGVAASARAGPLSMAPSTAPTATVPPCGTLISVRTPAEGAGTSTVTLSVSSSTIGSSAATASPCCLNHCPTVASVTDSPSAGTLISMGMAHTSGRQSLLEQRLLLLVVPAQQPRGRGCGGRPTRVGGTLGGKLEVLQHPFEVRFHEAPSAHVFRFLLRPHHLGVGKAAELGNQRARGKRIVLFDAQQIDVVDAGSLACLEEIIVELARTKHDPTDVAVWPEPDAARTDLRVVPQHAMKRGPRPQLGQIRHDPLVAQQRLGGHDHQRLAEFAMQLPPQNVEIVGGRRTVRHLPIVLCTELQEALEPRGGVLGSLSLVSVRQQANKPRHSKPLALAG